MDQNENQQPVAAPVKVESGFSFKGLVRVITSPTSFFEQLKDNPRVLVPILAMIAVGLISLFALKDIIMELQVDAMRDRGLPESQIQALTSGPLALIGPLLGMLGIALIPFITAGLAKLFGGFVMGGKADYWKVVAVMAYSEFVFFASSLISLPIQVYKETITEPFSLGVLQPNADMQSVMAVLLSKLSVFYVWEVVVAGIGLSILFNFSRNKGYLLAVLSLGLLSALHVGSAALGQMFQ